MLGIGTLASAVKALAGNVLALSQTVAEVNAGVRQRLQLDAPAEVPALPGPDEGEAAPAGRRNGRGKAARDA
jgi:hypothetical protein